jgi:hypothetical protein
MESTKQIASYGEKRDSQRFPYTSTVLFENLLNGNYYDGLTCLTAVAAGCVSRRIGHPK